MLLGPFLILLAWSVEPGCAHLREVNSGPASDSRQSGPPPPRPRSARFVSEEYATYSGEGTAVIAGQAFGKTRGGTVKVGAGNTVVLTPATSYTTEWWSRSVLHDEPLEPEDARASAYRRTTVADGSGNFKFEKLPAGEYFAVCEITWEAPTGGSGKYRYLEKQGVRVGKLIKVNGAESADVVLEPVSYWGSPAGTGCEEAPSHWLPATRE